MACRTPGCEREKRHGDLCGACYQRDWHARHPERRAKYLRDFRERNPRAVEAYNDGRRPSRACRTCRKPVGPRVQFCRGCKRAAGRRAARLQGQIGDQARDPVAVALLETVAFDPCAYCGGRADAIDHIEPRGRGGALDLENVAAVCGACNSAKRDHSLLKFMLRKRFVAEQGDLLEQRELIGGLV